MIDLALPKPDSKSVTLELMSQTAKNIQAASGVQNGQIHVTIPGIQPTKQPDDLTAVVSRIGAASGAIQSVFVDVVRNRGWGEIMAEAVACGAAEEPGLYICSYIDPSTKDHILEWVYTVKDDGTFMEGNHMTANANVTRWPPKKTN